ncbi:MAG TPA: Holliday junction resolvase RuvX [Candidatus Absconditabacterales bacterium]|nr:Holliday junction resolvase RuvX [Candidatus Absconditabacterales bacterium]
MTIKPKNVLGIDRGSKYIGLAYSPIDQDISFPLGYLLNDKMIYFNISDIIQRHNIRKIILGRPKRQKDIQEKIQDFIKSLEYIIDTQKIEIYTVEEDYTSVQSGEIVSNFKKNVAEDTVSAMLILERRKAKNSE